MKDLSTKSIAALKVMKKETINKSLTLKLVAIVYYKIGNNKIMEKYE